jgi:DNA replication regulator SLD3
MNELIAFLESLILPANMVDKKYKDGVPNLLSKLITLDGSAEEILKPPPKSTKLKNRKMKPGKSGLYPGEDTYLSRWWGLPDTDAYTDAPGESKEDIMRKRVAQLRIRETQLQMIVILETLALRPLATSPTDYIGELPSIGQIDGLSDDMIMTCSKSKKPLDLAVLIEVHVDRLCIWQSLAAEEGRTASTVGEVPIADRRPKVLANTHDHAANMLREFCVEVIVPL